jgi:hypothetical protein
LPVLVITSIPVTFWRIYLGGSLPNDAFTDGLGMPTVWIPHSYPACAQHAPDEHLLAPLARQALRLMAGLFWDLGEHPG